MNQVRKRVLGGAGKPLQVQERNPELGQGNRGIYAVDGVLAQRGAVQVDSAVLAEVKAGVRLHRSNLANERDEPRS